MKIERMLLTFAPLEVTAPHWEESYHATENLEHLMMEHTRGWPICCLIAHDTFGSFMKAQFVYSIEAHRRAPGISGPPVPSCWFTDWRVCWV
jgi:hypothetical protein